MKVNNWAAVIRSTRGLITQTKRVWVISSAICSVSFTTSLSAASAFVLSLLTHVTWLKKFLQQPQQTLLIWAVVDKEMFMRENICITIFSFISFILFPCLNLSSFFSTTPSINTPTVGVSTCPDRSIFFLSICILCKGLCLFFVYRALLCLEGEKKEGGKIQ